MSGARIIGSAALELQQRKAKLALATMCIGVGQSIAIALEAIWVLAFFRFSIELFTRSALPSTVALRSRNVMA